MQQLKQSVMMSESKSVLVYVVVGMKRTSLLTVAICGRMRVGRVVLMKAQVVEGCQWVA